MRFWRLAAVGRRRRCALLLQLKPDSRPAEHTPMSFPRAGGCGCEMVRYQLTSDPLTVYACHCTDCQTETGTSFALSMFVDRDAIELLRGKPRLRIFKLPDGRKRRVSACDECGASLWAETPDLPELLNLHPGTLDDTSWFRPVGHIWTRSAQSWVTIPPEALRYEKQAEDRLALVRAWKSRPDAPLGSTATG